MPNCIRGVAVVGETNGRGGIFTAMERAQLRAAEYRKQAATCLEVAKHISLKAHRDGLIEMAQHWLELARQAEAEAEGK